MVILKPLMSVYLRSACGNIEAFDECNVIVYSR